MGFPGANKRSGFIPPIPALDGIRAIAEIAAIRGDVAAAFSYSSNWYLIGVHRSYFQTFGRPSPFGHLWSLAIEEQFYLLWPVILTLLFARIRRPKRVAGLIGGAALLSA